MFVLTLLLVVPGQVEITESRVYPRELQLSAIKATVRIVNLSKKAEGSGVIIGRTAEHIYILTASHFVQRADQLDVCTFSARSYPKSQKRYQSVQVVAADRGIRDLAVVRVETQDPMPGVLRICPAPAVPSDEGFLALAVGCGHGKAPTCLADRVSKKLLVRRRPGDETALFWEVERKHVPGRSGGPLVSQRGYVLGVCSGTNRDKTYFCHTEEMRSFLKQNGLLSLVDRETGP